MNLILMKKIVKACKILRRAEYYKAFFSGVAAAVEHEVLLKNIFCKTIIDIGANRGQFSLVARHCFKDAQIFAFEPLPQPFKVLRNIFVHDRMVTLYQMAIGSASISQQMHISQRDDSSSLLPITELQNKVFPGTKEKAIIVYCESAPQSALVYLVLRKLGYPDVRLYLAGYDEWRLNYGFL